MLPSFYIPRPPNDEPDGPNQFLQFVCNPPLSRERGVSEIQLLKSSGFLQGDKFTWECEYISHVHRSGLHVYLACIWRREKT